MVHQNAASKGFYSISHHKNVSSKYTNSLCVPKSKSASFARNVQLVWNSCVLHRIMRSIEGLCSKQPITAACSIVYSMYRMDIGPLGNDSGNVECNIALHNLLKLHHCCSASSSAHHCCASFGWISCPVGQQMCLPAIRCTFRIRH